MNELDKPRAILSAANLTHYHNAAIALDTAGYLERYICSSGLKNPDAVWTSLLPNKLRNKLKSRTLPDISSNKISNIVYPEILARAFSAAGIISVERRNWLFGEFYDRAASRLVQDCDFFHFVSPSGLYSARIARQLGACVICDVRTAYPEFLRNIVSEESELYGFPFEPIGEYAFERKQEEFKLSDYLFLTSDFSASTFRAAGFAQSKICVIPRGVDLTRFAINARMIEKDHNKFIILFVGRVMYLKGVQYLLEAFSKLKLPSSELVLVGPVEEAFVPFLEKHCTKSSNIRVLGAVPKTEVHRYYQGASVFVFPSLSEGSALVVYEAMASGLPVVTTPNAGSVVRDGIEGFLTPIRDVDALMEKILRLYEKPGLRSSMSESAVKRAGEFTWRAYGQRLVETYDRIWNGKQSRGVKDAH